MHLRGDKHLFFSVKDFNCGLMHLCEKKQHLFSYQVIANKSDSSLKAQNKNLLLLQTVAK